ncbi:glutamate 5-kinase [Oscillospiraceae bacterium OttesenSCG-928-F05]|nr:glutamate 5-kinase [Oscillospiraceae bacterium OttesenSCG-928-F05]
MDGGKTPRRIVIKVGTSTLTYANGKLNLRNMDALCRVICDIKNRGDEVILVSSGAIAAGLARLNLPTEKRPDDLPTKQAAAAVGQVALIDIYSRFFAAHSYVTGQILLNSQDVGSEGRRENLMNTFSALLRLGAIPVVNENDSVTVKEIVIGDNDTLSATVAALLSADLLILMTDIDGLYDADPRKNPEARRIDTVSDFDAAEKLAGGSGTTRGTGGMATKVQAAREAAAHGIDTVVMGGDDPALLYDVLEGKPVGTRFQASRP